MMNKESKKNYIAEMKENFTSENGLMLKKAIINDKKNVVFNKKGKDLLDIE